MNANFKCPNCNEDLPIPQAQDDRFVMCPSCSNRVQVPEPEHITPVPAVSTPAPSPATAPQWWLASQGAPTGPHSEAFVLAGLKAGVILSQTKACPDGDQEWKRLCDWPAFAANCSSMPQPAAPEPITPAPTVSWLGGDKAMWERLRFIDKCIVVLWPAMVAFYWLWWLVGVGDKPGNVAKLSWADIRDSSLKDNCKLLAIMAPVYAMIGAALWGLWAMVSRFGLLKALACVLVPCVLLWVLRKIYKEVQKKTNTAVAVLVVALLSGCGILGFMWFAQNFTKAGEIYRLDGELVRCSSFSSSLKSNESSDDVLIRYNGLDEEGCELFAKFVGGNYDVVKKHLDEDYARKECVLVSPSVTVEILYTTGDKVTKNFDWPVWEVGTTKMVTFARPPLGKPERLRLEGHAYFGLNGRQFNGCYSKPSFAGEWDLMKE